MLRGFCVCCRQHVEFTISGPSLRSSYRCTNCSSVPRQRHLNFVLDTLNSQWEKLQIHESSPGGSYVSRRAKNYSFSQYLPHIPFGQRDENEIRSENLEKLTFNDQSFDLFITQDVFEHLYDPCQAAKEIMRVLKPGGYHVFTVPKHGRICEQSFPMAKINDSGDVEHLVSKPEYHGNPVGDGKSLVTWRYGSDFEFLLSKWTGVPVATFNTRDSYLGIDAEFNEVFVMRKW